MAPTSVLHDGAHDAYHRGGHGESCHAGDGTRRECHASVQLPCCWQDDQRPACQQHGLLNDPRQEQQPVPHYLSQPEAGPRTQGSKASS